MIEIKFRGWDHEHEVWRYGHIVRLVEGIRKFYAIISENEDGDLVRYYIHDPKSIGQFTGRKDKNGNEIYKGDIVYIAGYGDIEIEWPFSDLYDAAMENDIGEIKGNIYENPEL